MQTELKPNYTNIHLWEAYSENMLTEYQQCLEEGLNVAPYQDLFKAVAKLPQGEIKAKLGDTVFELIAQLAEKGETVEGYPYVEPSDLPGILEQRSGAAQPLPQSAIQTVSTLSESFMPESTATTSLQQRIHGAWMGRIVGCLLGKTVEGIRTNELIPFLKESGNYPMHRYILSTDVTAEIIEKYKFPFAKTCFADTANGMPVDDDTNYVIMAQEIIQQYGRDFTAQNVADTWLALQSKGAYCTAERVAFCNFVGGFEPPASAQYHNPYREWIGAQIRGDYFGYINPGQPETAAAMAFRDASISHVKNGIYGEMFAAAMVAAAACTSDIQEILQQGLAQIPARSRLHEAVTDVIRSFEQGVSQEDCFAEIHKRYDEYTDHGWCHTISNAMIVAAALLYGRGDFGKSICMAVETGFDTDCNGATVGSILGMAFGLSAIGEEWTAPINDTLHTSIFGVGTVKISDRVKMTMQHLQDKA